MDAATNDISPLVRLIDVSKCYAVGDQTVFALKHVSLAILPGEFIAILGPSGSGKSTLMHLLGCLDTPSTGTLYLKDRDITAISLREQAHIRNRQIGFVFQSFNLLQHFTAQQNVELPLVYAAVPRAERQRRARQMMDLVGLRERAHHRPVQLSGGERQRVAIARALVNDPLLLLADEPTGNLDSRTGENILQLFESLHRSGHTIIIVTHDLSIAKRAPRTISLSDGEIVP